MPVFPVVQQFGPTEQASGTTVAQTVSGIAPGNSLIVCVTVFNASSVTFTSVTDNAAGGSNTYAQRHSSGYANRTNATIFDCLSLSKGVPTTITATVGTAGSEISIVVFEVANIIGYDTGAAQQQVSATPNAGSVTTATPNEIAFVDLTHDGAQTTLTPPSGWNAGPEDEAITNDPISTGYQIFTAIQTAQTYNWSLGASRNASNAIEFYKLASGAVLLNPVLNMLVQPGLQRERAILLISPKPTGVAPTTFQQALTATVAWASSFQNTVLKNLSASVGWTGTIQKQIAKAMSASVAWSASIQKQVNKPLSASVAWTSSFAKTVNKTLQATDAWSASIARQVNKNLSASVSWTASIAKTVLKNMQASVAWSATMQALKVILVTLSASVAWSGSMQRTIQKNLSSSVAWGASITKTITKTLVATPVAWTGSVVAVFQAAGGAAVRRLRTLMGWGN